MPFAGPPLRFGDGGKPPPPATCLTWEALVQTGRLRWEATSPSPAFPSQITRHDLRSLRGEWGDNTMGLEDVDKSDK